MIRCMILFPHSLPNCSHDSLCSSCWQPGCLHQSLLRSSVHFRLSCLHPVLCWINAESPKLHQPDFRSWAPQPVQTWAVWSSYCSCDCSRYLATISSARRRTTATPPKSTCTCADSNLGRKSYRPPWSWKMASIHTWRAAWTAGFDCQWSPLSKTRPGQAAQRRSWPMETILWPFGKELHTSLRLSMCRVHAVWTSTCSLVRWLAKDFHLATWPSYPSSIATVCLASVARDGCAWSARTATVGKAGP